MPKSENYEEFVEKFKPQKTTDDCYTPQEVYEVVLKYVYEHITPIKDKRVLRPFYPGGDFEGETYLPGDIVIDNPPFSILARIIDFYNRLGVKYFLFAPHLTAFSYLSREGVTAIVANAQVTYENGAIVNTSFLTNAAPGHPAFIIDGNLSADIKEANAATKAKTREKAYRKISYPDCVTNAALLGKLVTEGLYLSIPRERVRFIRKLDAGVAIYGAGVILSDAATAAIKAAAIKAAAIKAAAIKAAAIKAAAKVEVYQLSEREEAIRRELSKND